MKGESLLVKQDALSLSDYLLAQASLSDFIDAAHTGRFAQFFDYCASRGAKNTPPTLTLLQTPDGRRGMEIDVQTSFPKTQRKLVYIQGGYFSMEFPFWPAASRPTPPS